MSFDLQSENLRLSNILTNWYLQNKRDLPWRETSDPYSIWLSEVILQQTRVDQGLSYYLRFTKNYPTIDLLANASEDEVLKLWQGLGYYSRARNLHHAAKTIVSNFGGQFPKDYKNILSLKGIGEYTAAAIASIAYKLPYAVVDGNVYRVLSRIFAIDTPIDSTIGKKMFADLAQKILNEQDPSTHNQAMMDFGAMQCVPSSPNCSCCPASDMCLAYAQKEVSKYPIKTGKVKVSKRYFNYFDIRYNGHLYLNKRDDKGIWRNMYELPLIETPKDYSFNELQQLEAFETLFSGNRDCLFKLKDRGVKHVLSHQIITANFYKIEIYNDQLLNNRFLKIKLTDLDKYAVSRLIEKYLFTADNDKT